MKDKRIITLLNNTFMMYIVQISNYIFPMFTFPYLTRVLNAEYYGMITYISAAMVYFQLLIDFGYILSATKEISDSRNDSKKLSIIYSTVMSAKLLLALVGFLVVFVMIQILPNFADKKVLTM